MFVDTELLHSGADGSRRAGGHARDGANHLSQAPLAAGMFGDFAAAESFLGTMRSAHAAHVDALQSHGDTLDDLGTKAHHAAYAFTSMDDDNAEVLREVS